MVAADDRQAIEPDPAPVDWVALGGMVAEALDVLGTEPPPPPPPPPDPDEDGVDWDALLVTAQTIDANLASVAMALDAAQSELAALRRVGRV